MSNLALISSIPPANSTPSASGDWQCSIAESGCAIITAPDGQAFEIEPGRQGFIGFIHRFAVAMQKTIPDAAMYQHLRNKDIDNNFPRAGLFIGKIPDNTALSGEDADAAVQAEMSLGAR